MRVAKPNQKQLAKEIGLRLKAAREGAAGGKLSQREAGRLAGFDSKAEDPQSRISNYERGRRSVTISDLLALADVYQVSPVYLTFGDREPPTEEGQLLEDFRRAPTDTQRIIRNILDCELRDRKTKKRQSDR